MSFCRACSTSLVFISTAVLLALLPGCQREFDSGGISKSDSKKPWVFVNSPDFFNFDIACPQPGWEPAIDWFLTQLKRENPDFFLVAGDLVGGRWWDSREQIEHLSAVYYGNWTRRMKDYGLTVYAAAGDHELGDDPWSAEKIRIVPLLKKAFTDNLGMPKNGPAGHEGRAYYVLHKNMLIITVEPFEVRDSQMHLTVSGEQLAWFEKVLKEHPDVDHVIVQGHLPVLGPVKARSSSGLMLEDGAKSEFWRLMKEYRVDLYLCGEFHDVTVSEKNGIHQIVHGAAWGRTETINYMVVKVWPSKLELEIKEFPVDLKGGTLWNINKPEGPREIVEIPEIVKRNGPQTIGSITIYKTLGGKQFIRHTGIFTRDARVWQDNQARQAERPIIK